MSNANKNGEVNFDRGVLGKEIDIGSHYVSEAELVSYAKSLGETNPIYIDPVFANSGPHRSIIATPGYYTAIPLKPSLDPNIEFTTNSFSYMAGQKVIYKNHIKAGDTLHARSQVTNVYTKTGRSGALIFIERKTTYLNQHNDTVLIVESSNVRADNKL
jgi:acyl dehydratase